MAVYVKYSDRSRLWLSLSRRQLCNHHSRKMMCMVYRIAGYTPGEPASTKVIEVSTLLHCLQLALNDCHAPCELSLLCREEFQYALSLERFLLLCFDVLAE